MRKSTDYIVVHCSATPGHMDVQAKDIDRWHRERGWLKIGYHFVITRDGTLQKGRDLDEVGAHVEGCNHNSVGICLAGGMDTNNKQTEDNFTAPQYTTLHLILDDLEKLFPQAKLVGHCELDPKKACPVLSMDALRGARVARHTVNTQLD